MSLGETLGKIDVVFGTNICNLVIFADPDKAESQNLHILPHQTAQGGTGDDGAAVGIPEECDGLIFPGSAAANHDRGFGSEGDPDLSGMKAAVHHIVGRKHGGVLVATDHIIAERNKQPISHCASPPPNAADAYG